MLEGPGRKTVRIDYGREGLDVEIPDGACVLETRPHPPLPDPLGAVREAIAPLATIARGRTNATIVVSDKTRPVPNALLLGPLLDLLAEAGIPAGATEVVVGTGLHRPNDPDELAAMLSPEVLARVRVRNHDARRPEGHVELGRTRRGTPIVVDAGYARASLKIVTGLVEPHLMAGWSGGRKGVVPGLASPRMMRALHGPEMLEDDVGPGRLDGNPFHEELVEIARTVGCDFLVNVGIDRARRLTGVFAGDLEEAHLAGVAHVEASVRVDADRPYDVVLASAGGSPLDATFYQSIKGLVAALNVVRRGGTIVLAAEMREGTGSEEFEGLLGAIDDPDRFVARLREPGVFTIDQWMAQHLCQVLRKADALVVAERFDERLVERLAIARAPSVEAALAHALAKHGSEATLAVLPEGPYTLATLRGRSFPLGRASAGEAA